MSAMNLQNLEERWIISGGRPIHLWQSSRVNSNCSATLVHLHGFGISGRYLLPTADLLASEYRTFVPNLPGYGRSVHPDHVLSIPELAASVIDFLDASEVERATLIGNSMGCFIAVETARIAPERVDRIVLVSPAGGRFNPPVFKGVVQLALDGFREPRGIYTIALPDYLRFGLLNTGKLFWRIVRYPTVNRFLETNSSTLVVLGARDPLVSEQRILAGALTNEHLQVVRIDGAAHAINYSHPARLAAVICRFVQELPLEDEPGSDNAVSILRQPRHAPACEPQPAKSA